MRRPVLSDKALAGVVLALLALHYLTLVSLVAGSRTLAVPSDLGFTFNSMALNLLAGHFDVDPQAIKYEAFVHQGRTYAYFGIFPALLRIPLIPFIDLAAVQVEGVSRYVALLLAAAGASVLVRALRASLKDFPAVGTMLLVAMFLSGPAVWLAFRPGIYNEVSLWNWVLSIWFLALAWPAISRGAAPATLRLCALAGLAGAALLTRPTSGAGLVVALAGLMVVILVQRSAANPDRRLATAWDAIWSRPFLLPAVVVAAFCVVAAGVNYGRWGDPFLFADVRMQLPMLAAWPDRVERLEHYGLFNINRLSFGFLYYFFPIWVWNEGGRFLFHDDIVRLFDAFELPPSSFFLSDPFSMLLASIGVISLLRGSLPGLSRARVFGVIVGLSFAPALMLVAWYMAFRYRADFMPLFVMLACLGAVRVSLRLTAMSARTALFCRSGLAALLLLQIVSAHIHGVAYAVSPYGPSAQYAVDGLLRFYVPEVWRR